jgi:hypothetical protein
MFGRQHRKPKITARLKNSRRPIQTSTTLEQEPDSKQIQRAIENPRSEFLTPDVVMQLQRTHGNQFVVQLTQKLRPPVSISNHVQVGGSASIQREPGDFLQKHYNEWNEVKSSKKDDDTKIYTTMRDIIVHGKYDSGKLDQLKKLVEARQGTSNDKKKQAVIGKILLAIGKEHGDPSLTLSDIALYFSMDEFQAVLAKATPSDKMDGEFLAARVKILKKLFTMDPFFSNVTQSQLPGKALQAAGKGVMSGFWVGRGMCDIAAEAFGGRTEFHSNDEIDWNHYIVIQGKSWTDPSYRQFFTESDWAKGPAMFKGTVEDFRNLGLDPDKTERYLRFIKRI